MGKNKLGVMPINKLVLNISGPLMVSMLVQALYNIVDSIFVARIDGIGDAGINAISIAFPIQLLGIAVAVGVGIGINAILSKSLGEKNYDKLKDVVNNGIVINVVISLLFVVAGIFFIDDFFRISTENELVRELGTTYLRIICIFSFVKIYLVQFQRMLQSTGLTKYQMASQGISAVLNIILDPILIFKFGMGIKGAAIATILAQFIGLLIAFTFNRIKNKELQLDFKHFVIKRVIIKEILRLAIPAILLQSLQCLMLFIVNRILYSISELYVSAYGIYYKYSSLIFMPVFGVNNAVIPIVSYNYGARNKKRIMDAYIFTLKFVSVIMFIGGILTFIFAPKIIGVYTPELELYEITLFATRINVCFFLFFGLNVVTQGFLQAMHSPNQSLEISLVKVFIFLLPLLVFISNFSFKYVWWGFVIAEFLTTLISMMMFSIVYRKKIKIIKD